MTPRRISVRGIIIHNDRLLCVKHKPYKRLTENITTYWALPGGGLEDNESLVDGIKRELLEETGVKATIGNLLYIQQFTFNKLDYLEFFFNIINSGDFLNIDLSKTLNGHLELAAIDFIDPRQEEVLPTFLTTENIIKKSRSNEAATIFSYTDLKPSS